MITLVFILVLFFICMIYVLCKAVAATFGVANVVLVVAIFLKASTTQAPAGKERTAPWVSKKTKTKSRIKSDWAVDKASTLVSIRFMFGDVILEAMIVWLRQPSVST